MSKLNDLIARLCPNGVLFDEIENLCLTLTPRVKIKSNDYLAEGLYPVIDQGQRFIGGYTNCKQVFPKNEYIIFGDHTCVVKYVNFAFAQGADGVKVLQAKKAVIIPRYLFHCMANIKLDVSYARHWSKMKKFKIPVPPLEVQREIVRILDSFTELTAELTAELNARRKQYEYYRDLLLTFDDGNVEFKPLGEIATVDIGEFVRQDKQGDDKQYPVFNGGRSFTGKYDDFNRDGEYIIISARGNAGFVNYFIGKYWAGNSCYSVNVDQSIIDFKFAYHFLKSSERSFMDKQQKGGIPAISKKQVSEVKIPVPPLEEQERIVKILDRFDKLCNDLSEGLPAEIEARRKQYEYFRDKLLTFEEAN